MRDDERALFLIMAFASCVSLVIIACVMVACDAAIYSGSGDGAGEVAAVGVGEENKEDFGEEEGKKEEEREEENKETFENEEVEFSEVLEEVRESGEWGVVVPFEYGGYDYWVGTPDDCRRFAWEWSRSDGESAPAYIVRPSGSVLPSSAGRACEFFDAMGR